MQINFLKNKAKEWLRLHIIKSIQSLAIVNQAILLFCLPIGYKINILVTKISTKNYIFGHIDQILQLISNITW